MGNWFEDRILEEELKKKSSKAKPCIDHRKDRNQLSDAILLEMMLETKRETSKLRHNNRTKAVMVFLVLIGTI